VSSDTRKSLQSWFFFCSFGSNPVLRSIHSQTEKQSIHYNKFASSILVKGKLAEKSESFLIKVNGGSRRGGGGAISLSKVSRLIVTIMCAFMKRQEPCTCINATWLFAYPTLVNACIYPHLYS
jgi:hypothetical protein